MVLGSIHYHHHGITDLKYYYNTSYGFLIILYSIIFLAPIFLKLTGWPQHTPMVGNVLTHTERSHRHIIFSPQKKREVTWLGRPDSIHTSCRSESSNKSLVVLDKDSIPPSSVRQNEQRHDHQWQALSSHQKTIFFPLILVYGHITLNTPVLVRSLKLSKVETC